MNWQLALDNAELVHFFGRLVAFRRYHELFRHIDWSLAGDSEHTDVRFHGVELNRPDWSQASRTLALELSWRRERVLIIINAYWEPLTFALPALAAPKVWRRAIDTRLKGISGGPLSEQGWYEAGARSVAVLEAWPAT